MLRQQLAALLASKREKKKKKKKEEKNNICIRVRAIHMQVTNMLNCRIIR